MGLRLNGMDSSLEQNPDGTYAFNFEPDEFLRIGEAIGMTAEQVAACTYALGMFGDLHLYRLEELENCLTGISIAAKDGERSVLSLQGIEDMLSWQYDAPGVQEVIQDIRGMEKIELLDFSTEDAASLQALIDRLTELKLLETDGGVIHADSLAQTLQERFGMAANDIEMFLGNLEKTGFMLKDTADGTKSPLPKKHSEQKEQVSKDPKEHTPETAINGLSDDITSLNTQDTENITQEFHNLGKTVGNVSQRVSRLSGLIDEVNGKRISIASSSAAAAQGPSGQPVKGAPKTKKDSKNAGSASAMGNAQVGPAYLSGSIGAPRTETALINELGNETIIDPKTGTYEIVGGGAQFRKIKKGQIILNHLQTKALQTYGRISSFGRMLFSGNARLKGSAYYYGTAGSQSLPKSENGSGTGNTPVSDRNKPDTDPKKSAKETEKAFEQLFHWLERRVKVLQNAWNQWLSQAETALTGRFITNYYKKAQASLKQEMDAYRQSYDIYMNQANASGLGEAYAQKVRDGSLGIESVTDKELADQISSYKEWYEKAEEASEAFAEAAEKLYRLPLDKAADKIERFENSMTLLDKQIQNAVGAKAKNSLLTQKDKKKEKTLHVQEKALKESKQNLKAAAKALKQPGTLAGNGLTKKEKKQLKKDVKNRREIDPSRFKKGSRAYQAAVKYNEALKAKTEAKQQNRLAQEDFTAWKSQSAKLKFDNISDEYEKRLRLTGHDVTKTDNEIALLKASGRSVTESLYQTQKTNYAAELAQYQKQQAALNASLAQIPKGTDEWHDANDKLQQVTSSISDCQTKIYGMNDAILNLRFDRFDELSASISRIREEQEFLQDLFSHEEMTDNETGQFTNAGLAKLASLSASYHAAVYEADRQKALLTQLQQVRAEGAQDDGSYKFGDWEFNSLEQLEEKIEETYAKWQKSSPRRN